MSNAKRSKRVGVATSVALRIELCDIEPLIWRRIVVSTSWLMATLHTYLQWVMGWQDTHAHEFRIGDHVIAAHWWIKESSLDRDTERDRDERRVMVGTVISEAAVSGEFEYLYDMGDDWRHRLVIESDGGARAPEVSGFPFAPPERTPVHRMTSVAHRATRVSWRHWRTRTMRITPTC